MSTTNRTATGNKRRRTGRRDEERVGAGGFAASGSAAAANANANNNSNANATASTAILPSELKSALGSRLQPIM